MDLRFSILPGIFILCLFASCDKNGKDDPQLLPEKADVCTQRVTDFIHQAILFRWIAGLRQRLVFDHWDASLHVLMK